MGEETEGVKMCTIYVFLSIHGGDTKRLTTVQFVYHSVVSVCFELAFLRRPAGKMEKIGFDLVCCFRAKGKCLGSAAE